MKATKCPSLLAGLLSLALLPAAFAGGADKKFSKMDTDGDGKISRTEHAAGAQRMFAEMDTDGDGAVTATEMNAKKDAKPGDKNHGDKSSAEKIKMLDQNADGRLTAAEHAAGSDSMFEKMDTDGDGSLSREELESGHKMKMKEKRH